MDSAASSKFLFIFLISYIFVLCSSGSFLSDLKDIVQKPTKRADAEKLAPHRKQLIYTTQHDFTNPPLSTYPTTPVTNPVTTPATGAATITPPDFSTPPTIMVPSANPVAATPIPPSPVTTFPGGQPVTTNPVTNPADGGVPAVAQPAVGNAPAVPGQSWCVARGRLPETVLQVALDYACGIGGADCSTIQQGASCYNPNSLQNHSSFAFNSYYQKNPVQTSCDFGGAAMVTNVNPSSSSCIFPTWSSSSASPATVSPTTTTPMPNLTTDCSYGAAPDGSGTPPTLLNASNPALGGGIAGYIESPPTASISSTGSSKPFIALALSVITWSIAHGI